MSQDLMGQLQQLLQDPDTVDKLKNVLGGLGQQPNEPEFREEDTVRLQKAISGINSTPDPRVSLLKALKPYMNPNRSAQVDTAVRLLGLTKMSGLLREFQ